jgi:antiviral helicase SLH1
MGVSLDLLTDDRTLPAIRGYTIRIVTASHLLGILPRLHDTLEGLKLVLCENLEQLTSSYELSISLLRHATQSQPTRFVGMSSSLNDAADLAAWLNVDPFALHSFRPRDRDQSLSVSTQAFTIPQSAALFKAMAKPAHSAIAAAPGEAAIVFVPSRGQCRPVARDLMTQSALESETGRGYLPDDYPEDYLEDRLARLKDRSFVEFLTRGIGFFHDGIDRTDRALMLSLYAEGALRVFIVPRDACWTLPIRAGVVLVLGTQYIHVDASGGARQVRDYALDELVRMQGRAVRHNGLGRFHLFCQAEGKDTFTRFLDEGLPLESKLLSDNVLKYWYAAERRNGKIKTKEQAVEALSWTFLARKLVTNPVYYDASSLSIEDSLSRIVDALDGEV